MTLNFFLLVPKGSDAVKIKKSKSWKASVMEVFNIDIKEVPIPPNLERKLLEAQDRQATGMAQKKQANKAQKKI